MMASATVLYTPEVLALATSLAAHRLDHTLPLSAEARSRSCGSTLAMGLALDDQGRIARLGLRSQACAIGQASAAIFAQAAQGRSAADILLVADSVEQWLVGEGPLPEWPGFEAIAPARGYPGRHGAILLPWNAARQILRDAAPGS